MNRICRSVRLGHRRGCFREPSTSPLSLAGAVLHGCAACALCFLTASAVLFTSCSKPANAPLEQHSVAVYEITTPSGVEMVLLPGGTFEMGSELQPNEMPRHQVHVAAFAIDKTEVTQEQLAQLEIPDPSHFKHPDRPVEQIRWVDAALFCNARSEAEGLEPCYDEVSLECNFESSGYRLPTEAEWEYAARCGTDTEFWFGGSPQQLESHACYRDTSKKKTELVKRKRANAWGLYDMSGNVAEWCHDYYSEDYYRSSPANDPRGPEAARKRVVRGGSWQSTADACRPAARHAETGGFTDACFTGDTLGFRCVRRPNPTELDQLNQPDRADGS